MINPESAFLAGSLFCYLATLTVDFFRREGLTATLLTTGLLFHFASAALRWSAIGHPPIFGTYEAALAGSWFIMLFVVSSYRSVQGHFRPMVLTAVPVALLIVIYGLTYNTERIPLTISEQSLWVDFHALFSWLAFAPFTLAFCLSVYYLGKRGDRKAAQKSAHDAEGVKYPDLVIIDELSFRYINFGFINHTIMFALGCYYSSILYGYWWQWDPAESTSLITWLSVALYIHMRLFYNWRGRRAAWLFFVIYLTVIFSYWGLIYLPPGSTFHVFDIEMKAH